MRKRETFFLFSILLPGKKICRKIFILLYSLSFFHILFFIYLVNQLFHCYKEDIFNYTQYRKQKRATRGQIRNYILQLCVCACVRVCVERAKACPKKRKTVYFVFYILNYKFFKIYCLFSCLLSLFYYFSMYYFLLFFSNYAIYFILLF